MLALACNNLVNVQVLTIKLSRFDEFARENLGLGILGGDGALFQVKISHLLGLLAISYIPLQNFIYLLARTFRFLCKIIITYYIEVFSYQS